MVWTEETVEELKKMWDRGMTTGQIAKALGVTKNSIIGKVHRLCLTARPSPIKKSKPDSEKKSDTSTKSNTDVKKKKTSKAEAKSKSEAKTKVKSTTKKDEKKVAENVKEPDVIEPVKEELNIPLIKLDNHTCRWPLGDPRDDDFCFCGKRIKTSQTYCDEHSAIAYVRSGKKI